MSLLWVYLLANLAHATAHLLTARACGIQIDRISLGLGPTLWQRSWQGTTVRLTALPLGFLVRLQSPWKKGEPVELAPGSFRVASPLRRLLVICAPLVMLLVLAWGAAFHWHGVGVLQGGTPYLGAVEKGWPAEVAGLRGGDLILRIDGQPIDRWEQLQQAVVAARGRPLKLLLQRGTATLERTVTPRKVGDRWLVGLHAGRPLRRVDGLLERAKMAVRTVFATLGETLGAFGTILWGQYTDTVGGPIAIVTQPQDPAARASRNADVFVHTFVSYLLLCLLPFPYLDGRRLLFWLIGLAARSPLHPRWEQGYNRWGFTVVALLLLLVVAADLLRAFS